MGEATFEINGLGYLITGKGKAEVIKNNNIEGTEFEIPNKVAYNGVEYTVTKIGESIFQVNNKISKLKISSSIEIVGRYACYRSHSLKEVQISLDSKLIRFDDHCFDGCNSLDTISFPPKLRYIGKYSLCSTKISSVHISKDINEINVGAFALCPLLASFSVDQSNQHFIVYNGSLYSKNMRRFIAANFVVDIWIKDSVEIILAGSLSMNSIQRIHLPYMLKSLGVIDFSSIVKKVEIIYCGIRKFNSLETISSANVEFRLITAAFSPFKTNFGIESVEIIDFCTIDVIINPFLTCPGRRKFKPVGLMLFFIFYEAE